MLLVLGVEPLPNIRDGIFVKRLVKATKIALGHSRSARTAGLAECTPKLLASYEAAQNNRTFGLPGNNHGLAAQIRVVPLLDGSIERVHVDMDDFAHNLLVTILILAQGQV